MKFKFKIQQYQTDAVESTVAVFAGQPNVQGLHYRRDVGVKLSGYEQEQDAKLLFPLSTSVAADSAEEDAGCHQAVYGG